MEAAYADRALGQQLRDTVVPADRGKIFSARRVLLAANSSCWTLRAPPREMPEDKLALAAPQPCRNIGTGRGQALWNSSATATPTTALLRYRGGPGDSRPGADLCAENGITGIRINQDSRRWYPQGSCWHSVLGFTNVDNAGVSGLELRYDDLLTGEDGVVLTAVNAWGYTLEQSYETERFPTEGDGLRLTIDANIQHYLENALCYAVKEHHVAARAVGIVMDVNTGAVLAMTTTPGLRPQPARVIADKTTRQTVESLTGEERKSRPAAGPADQWRNKAVSDLYEPGSVFKLITCAAALDARGHYQGLQLYCGESISVAGTRFHCANHKRHRGPDRHPGAGKLLQPELHPDRCPAGQRGFLRLLCRLRTCRAPTGIDLPAEPKKSLYYTADRMGPVELASCAFGQSSKISYLEMAAAVCAVVNGAA